MKEKIKKTAAVSVLSIFLGSQIVTVSPAFSQEYKVLPPSTQNSNFTPVQSVSVDSTWSQNNVLRGKIVTIPSGTSIPAEFNTTVTSAASQVGDVFTAVLGSPITLDGNVIIPENSEIIGQVTYVEPAGRIGKNASMDVKFTAIKLPNGQKIPINGKLATANKSGTLSGGSLKKQIVTAAATGAVSTAGGTLAGLGIGALMGSPGGGAVFGTTVGGIFGLGYIFARKGKEVVIPSGTKINVLLEEPVSVPKY